MIMTNLIEFTHYNNIELEGLLLTLFNDRTTAIIEDDKVIVDSVFTNCVGFDTESTTIFEDETKKKVKHCFCYTFQVAIANYYAIYRTKEQFINFLSILKDVIDYKNINEPAPAKCYIWVANLAHEMSFIKYWITDNFEVSKMFAKSQRDCLLMEFNNIQFRECIGLFGHSLADIAKNWTETQKLKGDLDYNLIRTSFTPLTETEKQYCINDVMILTEMHTAILKAYKQQNGALRIPYTASGFVRMKLKENIRNDQELTEELERINENRKKPIKSNIDLLKYKNRKAFASPAQWIMCRDFAYTGGLCGSNIEKVGRTLKNVKCADLTSDYPAQMLHCNFPYGWLKNVSRETFSIAIKQKKPFFILCRACLKSFTNHATFSQHKMLNFKSKQWQDVFGEPTNLIVYNGKIHKVENAIIIMNDVDLSAYKMIYDMKIDIIDMWQFDGYKKLPNWITSAVIDSYEKKAVLKHDGQKDTIEYKDSKRDVNSYYGVFAQRDTDLLDIMIDGLFTNSKERTPKQQLCQHWLYPYIAFWVTSYARRILMYFISKYPDSIIQYDTDSLYYTENKELETALLKYNEKQKKINERIFKDNPHKELLLDLGMWDFEETYDQFLGMGAKKYVKQTGNKIETVIAGLPKKAIPKEIEAKNIKKPLEHYNVVRKYILNNDPKIIIENMFIDKFASDYNDDKTENFEQITDYQGITANQLCGCYHALKPIDFTLSMGVTYLKHILHINDFDFK